METVDETVRATAANVSPGRRAPTKGEIFKVLDFFLAMTLHDIKGERRDYWERPRPDVQQIFPPPDLDKCGVSSAVRGNRLRVSPRHVR
mmetsp:Transcript_13649/g.43110  ORF Transcript_13649/g.43110 Transcript_13649/m.43110 type:complete len:89 (-) Transcript_13649:1304-1570(-)